CDRGGPRGRPADLRRHLGARSPRGRRRGDRSGCARAVSRADDDRRHLPRAARPVSDVVIRAAQRDDVPLLLELFGELAAYEQIEHELKATPELLARALFAERPVAEALIAMRGGDAAGYAIYFTTFSSFRCKIGRAHV